MTQSESVCPECGNIWKNGKTCQDHFNQMLAWDFEDFSGAGQVHHLTVLCYHLQHPRLYSSEAFEGAKQQLKEIIENNLTGLDLFHKNREALKSKGRPQKYKGTEENHGAYPSPIHWAMKASDVVAEGLEKYPETVKKWGRSIYDTLKTSGDLI